MPLTSHSLDLLSTQKRIHPDTIEAQLTAKILSLISLGIYINLLSAAGQPDNYPQSTHNVWSACTDRLVTTGSCNVDLLLRLIQALHLR